MSDSIVEPFIGEVRMFAGNYAPVGWALCDGSLLQLSEYTLLFTLIETTYGGDGVTTFAVPDLRGRAPLHKGAGSGITPIQLGEMGGKEAVSLTTRNTPPHTHQLDAVGGEATTDTPFATAMLAVGAKNVYVENKQYPVVPATDPPTTKGPTLAAMSSLSVGTFTGGSKPVSIMQPFLAVNFIIALDGIFPPRS